MQPITLSMDANLLFSLINMKLRNEYDDLDDLCSSLALDQAALVEKLTNSGFIFCEDIKQFHLAK